MATETEPPQPPPPPRFDEAVEWFHERTPLTAAEWAALEAAAQQQAFKIAGFSTAEAVGAVLVSLERSTATGESFQKWKKRMESVLVAEWGDSVANPGARMETIFRNATQSAYSRGRWKQQTKPEVLKRRPYFRFISVEDPRRTLICKKCGGVILPAEHPFWLSHNPPLHHRCRSSIQSLTTKQAERLGITTKVPLAKAQKGFGLSPDNPWSPKEKDLHPALREPYRAKKKGRKKKRKPSA